ncbi:hypothetical protein DFS34DRAFT_649746 [Phlyctochytrium arcticum]|nr:hypothetical protein DFS34DRAFT_649746 [Phlyctochytrium arcticum]
MIPPTLPTVLLTTIILTVTSSVLSQAQKSPTTTTRKTPAYPDTSFPSCKSPSDIRTRQEWRQLTAAQRQDYLSAVQCMRAPGKNGANTLFADFADVHRVAVTNRWAHGSPLFLPWHRMLLGLFEHALRSECDYNGPLPYWDWSFDNTNLGNSRVMTDFGGDGVRASQYCVTSGPFASRDTNACIKRNFLQQQQSTTTTSAGSFAWSWIEMENDLALSTTYATLVSRLEIGGHGAIHNYVGGNNGHMSFLTDAARDALFWLHHANVDRWWSEWQSDHPTLALQYNGKSLSGGAVKEGDMMRFNNLRSDTTVKQALATGKGANGLMCYKYAPPLRQTTSGQKATMTQSSANAVDANTTIPARRTRTDRRMTAPPKQLAPRIPIPESVLSNNNCTDSCVASHRQLESEQDAFIHFVNAAGWVSRSPSLLSDYSSDDESFESFTEEEYQLHKKEALVLIQQSPGYANRVNTSLPEPA